MSHALHPEPFDLRALRRRTVEIDYRHRHNHLASSLSALPIIALIYQRMSAGDVFVLSKGHAAAAWYAVLEACGYRPDVTRVHPDRDPANGIHATSGSLGHGLPLAVGMALAHRRRGQASLVHVLLGDAEAMEGTTWEALNLARLLELKSHLHVHLDDNGWGGMGRAPELWQGMNALYPVWSYGIPKGDGVSLFRQHPDWHVHWITDDEYAGMMEELA